MFVFKQMLHIVTVNVCQMKKTPAAQLKQHCQCKNVMGLYLHRVSTGVAVHYTNGRFENAQYTTRGRQRVKPSGVQLKPLLLNHCVLILV